MCIGSKLKSKWQFGNMFDSTYHNVLYNPARGKIENPTHIYRVKVGFSWKIKIFTKISFLFR